MDIIDQNGYRITDTHVFFYKKWLSNFHRCKFDWKFVYKGSDSEVGLQTDTMTFFCTEQAFMWAKAIYFGDDEIAEKIMNATSPSECKKLGREVRNYNDVAWSKIRYEIMRDVNYAKFSQNMELRIMLFHTCYGKKIVEASPIDTIWGVGIPLEDDAIVLEENWKGQNLLGKALTEVMKMISLDGMLKVKDVIAHLQKYDQEACVLVFEPNAFECGCWQHTTKNDLLHCIQSVEEAKTLSSYSDEEFEKDFKYAEPRDVIIRF